MKRKVLIFILVMLLNLALSGCVTISPREPLWMEAERTVTQYWQAIINRQYELAKCYCYPFGIWYNKVDEWEEYINNNSEGETSLMIFLDKFYKPTKLIKENIYNPDIRNSAVIYVKIITHKIPFPGSLVEMDLDVFEYETELINPNYSSGYWMLK
jgi:hypothetical protein